MSETIEVCPCRCHKQSGHFHCFTPACCESVNRIGEFLRPKRVYEEFKPDPNSFKTFTFPQIREVWPSLIANSLIDVQPMTQALDRIADLKNTDLGDRIKELIEIQAKELVEEESEDGLEAGP